MKIEGKICILDIEGDNLYQPKHQIKPSVIHCATTHSLSSGRKTHFSPRIIRNLPSHLKSFDYICGHNLMGYDRPLINDIFGYEIPFEKCIDTWYMSLLVNSLRKSHTVESYGEQFGRKKPGHEDWSQYSEEMKFRNMEDVEIQTMMFRYLQRKFEELQIPYQELWNEQFTASELFQAQWYGFPFDNEKAFNLLEFFHEKQQEVEDGLRSLLPPRYKPRGAVQNWTTGLWDKVSTREPDFNKDGTLSVNTLRWLSKGYCESDFTVGNSWTEIDRLPWDFKSRPFLVKSLQAAGAKFNHFTDRGMPQTDEESLEYIWKTQGIEIAKMLLEYLMLQKRIQDLSKWIDEWNPQTRSIHGKIFTIGTRTHRMSHSDPPLTQATSLKKPYGPELRELFGCPDLGPYCLVGTDASGIQGRILGHYTGSEEYIRVLTEEDIHLYNCHLMGFDKDRRSNLKTFYYAWILGCGVGKASEILGIPKDDAKERMDRFIQGTPGMQEMLDRYSKAALRGYVRSDISGRVFPIRSDKTQGFGKDKRVWHGEWLSSFLQGDESALMKAAFQLWTKRLREMNIPFQLVYWNHDEWQTLCRDEDASTVGRIQVWSIEEVGRRYNVKCPLTGEWIKGYNWKETH